jgi:hypothetical protein
MGYDLNRFDGNVDEELICPICSYILEDPVQVLFTFIDPFIDEYIAFIFNKNDF